MYVKSIVCYKILFILVPADGVKGKTWGPSSGSAGGGGGGPVKVRPALSNVTDGVDGAATEYGANNSQITTPAAERRAGAMTAVTSVPELGKPSVCIELRILTNICTVHMHIPDMRETPFFYAILSGW